MEGRKAETLTKCPRCGIHYLASDPVLKAEHDTEKGTCSREEAERRTRAFWRTVERDLSRRAGG